MIHLDGVTLRFEMSLFGADEFNEEIDRPWNIRECGTSCCLVGLGAAMYPGLIDIDTPWSSVSARLYGIPAVDEEDIDPDEVGFNSKTWNFLFNWKNPSDPIDAANRIIHVLKFGSPDAGVFFKPLHRDAAKLVEELTAMLVP